VRIGGRNVDIEYEADVKAKTGAMMIKVNDWSFHGQPPTAVVCMIVVDFIDRARLQPLQRAVRTKTQLELRAGALKTELYMAPRGTRKRRTKAEIASSFASDSVTWSWVPGQRVHRPVCTRCGRVFASTAEATSHTCQTDASLDEEAVHGLVGVDADHLPDGVVSSCCQLWHPLRFRQP